MEPKQAKMDVEKFEIHVKQLSNDETSMTTNYKRSYNEENTKIFGME